MPSEACYESMLAEFLRSRTRYYLFQTFLASSELIGICDMLDFVPCIQQSSSPSSKRNLPWNLHLVGPGDQL